MDSAKSIKGVCQGGETLIPGLYNDITLEHIVTKASWRTLCGLACVNRAWKRAFEEREVHNCRKRTQSCQTLLFFAVWSKFDQCEVVPYDPQQQLAPRLPMQPQPPPARPEKFFREGIRVVILDEKLYLLEDFKNFTGTIFLSRLHMLDLGACQHYWKPCAATNIHPCAVVCVPCDGKLYAFSNFCEVVNGEVYDPKKDQWSLIVDKLQLDGQYAINGASMVVCLNKEIYIPLESYSPQRHGENWESEKIMAVFNCSTEEWRLVEDTTPERPSLFANEGRLYNLSCRSVDVYDPSSNSWSMFQPVLFGSFRHPGVTFLHFALRVVSQGNELLVLTSYTDFPDKKFVCRSLGFGLQGQPLVWEVLPCNNLPQCLDSFSYLLGCKFCAEHLMETRLRLTTVEVSPVG